MYFRRIEKSVLLSTLFVGVVIVLSSFLWAIGPSVERGGTMHTPLGFPLSFVSQEQSISDYRYTARYSLWALFDVVPATETHNARFVFNPVRVTVFGLSIFTWTRTDESSVTTTIAMIPFVINVLLVQILLYACYTTFPIIRKYFNFLTVRNVLVAFIFASLALNWENIYYIIRYQLTGEDARISNPPGMRMSIPSVPQPSTMPSPIEE